MACDFLIIDTNNMVSRCNATWTKVKDQNYVLLSFLRSLKKAIDDHQPKKVIMAIDDYHGNSFRKTILPQYKANRKKKQQDEFYEDFKKQKEMAFAMLEHVLPVHCLKYRGYEADDIIAMICRIASDDVKIVVWSGDRDLIQLQQKMPQVRVYDPQKKEFFTSPEYDIVTYKSILGDPSDNIPGIRGIGKKSVTRVMASSSEFIKQIASKPERYIQYRTNLKIIDLIDNDLPVPEDLPEILVQHTKYSEKDFMNVAREYGFNDIVRNSAGYNGVFFDLALKSRTKRDWFFNKKEQVNA